MDFRLVFDYDGVLFNNQKASHLISERASNFVCMKLKIPLHEAREINKVTYKAFGHTLKLLEKQGVDTTLQEYNEYVYDDTIWDYIESKIKPNDYNNLMDVFALNEIQNGKSILLTNAPYEWVERSMDIVGMHPNTLFDNVYTPKTIDELKPNNIMYDSIASKYPHEKLLFIDNKIMNIEYLNHKWRTKLYQKHDSVFHTGCSLIEEELLHNREISLLKNAIKQV